MKALAASILGIGLLTACSAAPMPLCDGIAQNGAGSSIYSLASGDQLEIVVFRQPDLSGEFSLDGEGYLALPLVGEIAADGLSTRQLEDEIERRLKADDFLVSPRSACSSRPIDRSTSWARSARPAGSSIAMA